MVKRFLGVALVVAMLVAVAGLSSVEAKAGKGFLYLNDKVVGTVVPASSLTREGTDPLYRVTNGVPEQLGIAGIGPGEVGYSGGDWMVYTVTFNVAPYLLTSDEAVAAAETAGDVTVTRAPELDFRCPLTQVNKK